MSSLLGDILSEKFLVDIFKIIIFSKRTNEISYDMISQSKNNQTILVVIFRAIAEIGIKVFYTKIIRNQFQNDDLKQELLQVIYKFKVVNRFIDDFVKVYFLNLNLE